MAFFTATTPVTIHPSNPERDASYAAKNEMAPTMWNDHAIGGQGIFVEVPLPTQEELDAIALAEAEDAAGQEEEGEEDVPQAGGHEPEGPEDSGDDSDDGHEANRPSKQPRIERLSAKEFEKRISKMPASERVAAVKEMAERVAKERGFKGKEDQSVRNIAAKNNNRLVFRDPKTKDIYSVDTQHGRFEKCHPKTGRHVGEFDFDFNRTKGPDLSGKHDLKVK